MSNLKLSSLLPSAVIAVAGMTLAAGSPKPPAVPAKLAVSVAPNAVAPGDRARVTVRLDPIEGVQINRYPRITLEIPARDGLIPASEAAIGNTAPPAPGTLDSNYFETVDPLTLDLQVDASAPRGTHTLSGQLTYFYCVKASGFCAPKKTALEIPLRVR